MSNSDEGSKRDGKDEGWWQASDPEKVSQFLQRWQEWMGNSDHEKNLAEWKTMQDQMMASFQDFWENNSHEGRGVSTESGKGDKRDKADREKPSAKGHQSPSDAFMGTILYLLQRQDALEERIRKLEAKSGKSS